MSDEKIKANQQQFLKEIFFNENVADVSIWYPRLEHSVNKVQLSLMDVRAADDIRVSFDFDRNGWKIEQASTFEFAADDDVMDADWQEVAFIQAWGRSSLSK